MDIFNGISASDGVGIGKAFVIPDVGKRIVPQKSIASSEIESGWNRFENAVAVVSKQLAEDKRTVSTDKTQKEIFETYLIMLSDPVFIKDVKTAYHNALYNIDYILNKKIDE